MPSDRPPGISDLRTLLLAYAHIAWDFRFYYRELPELVHQDPELAADYRAVREKGLANVEAIFIYFVEADIMIEPWDADALPELARVIWMLADSWLNFEEIGGTVIGPDALDRGVRPIMQVLDPYLTDRARRSLIH